MIKNFHWGHGITIFYIVFVGVVIIALIASFSVDHSLVVKDYYSHDLAYQSKYEKIKNAMNSNSIVIKLDQNKMLISFPNANEISGVIYFYRPSDMTKDFNFEITGVNQIIDIQDKDLGNWKVKVDWIQDGIPFYYEEVLYF